MRHVQRERVQEQHGGPAARARRSSRLRPRDRGLHRALPRAARRPAAPPRSRSATRCGGAPSSRRALPERRQARPDVAHALHHAAPRRSRPSRTARSAARPRSRRSPGRTGSRARAARRRGAASASCSLARAHHRAAAQARDGVVVEDRRPRRWARRRPPPRRRSPPARPPSRPARAAARSTRAGVDVADGEPRARLGQAAARAARPTWPTPCTRDVQRPASRAPALRGGRRSTANTPRAASAGGVDACAPAGVWLDVRGQPRHHRHVAQRRCPCRSRCGSARRAGRTARA